MDKAADFTRDAPAVFDDLKAVLLPFAPALVVKDDTNDTYTLITAHIGKNKQPMWFASVCIKKNYVSFHLVPVYLEPALLENLPPELRTRMQGLACFNFRKRDPALFAQLATLVQACFDHYRAHDMLQ